VVDSAENTNPESPTAVRIAAAIVAVEAAAMLCGAVVLVGLTVVHTTTRLWAALALAGFAALGAGILWLCASSLRQLRPSARSPVVLIQLLALPVTYSLGFQGSRVAIAVPIMVAAVAVLLLLLTRSARNALNRVL
jgi:hypothetical protein